MNSDVKEAILYKATAVWKEIDHESPNESIELIRACLTDSFFYGMAIAAIMLNATQSEILLACGEMTAGEMRTAKAVLAWKAAQIRERAK